MKENEMVAEVFAGVTALKAAFDLTKGLKDIDDRVRLNSAVMDLQEKILTAQQSQTSLVEAVGDLGKEVAALKAWGADKQRYELKDLGKGFYAYIPKQGMENGEDPHGLCTNCYQKGFKSILQSSGHVIVHDRTWNCHACNAKVKSQSNDMGHLIAKCRTPATS
jgi:hypothetical protein